MASGIAIYTVATSIAAAGVATAVAGTDAGLNYLAGVSAGGVLIYVNLIWIARLVRRLLTGPADKARFALGLGLKMVLIYGTAATLVALRIVEALPFLIGISGLFVSVAAAGIRRKSGQ